MKWALVRNRLPAEPTAVSSPPGEREVSLSVCLLLVVCLPEHSAPLLIHPSVYTVSVQHSVLTTGQQTCGRDKPLIDEAWYIIIRLLWSQQDLRQIYLQPVLDIFDSMMSPSSWDIASSPSMRWWFSPRRRFHKKRKWAAPQNWVAGGFRNSRHVILSTTKLQIIVARSLNKYILEFTYLMSLIVGLVVQCN